METDNGVQAQAGDSGFFLSSREPVQPLLQCGLILTVGKTGYWPTRLVLADEVLPTLRTPSPN